MQDGRSLQRRVSLATILTLLGWPAISPSPMCAGYIKTSLVAAGGLLDLGEADLGGHFVGVEDLGAVGPVVVGVGGVVVDEEDVDGAGGLEEGPDGVALPFCWVSQYLEVMYAMLEVLTNASIDEV